MAIDVITLALAKKYTDAHGGKGEPNKVDDVQINGTSIVADKVANIGVSDSVTSFSTTDSLSANMGRELQAQISNLKNIGRFLSIWDCTTGLPLTEPVEGTPYNFKTGDYYRVGVIAAEGGTNYKPDGSSYTGAASTVEESGEVKIGWVYYYDGDSWEVQSSGSSGKVQDVQIDGETILNLSSGVANITHATDEKSGTFKTSASLGTLVQDSDKVLRAGVMTYVQYTNADANAFVGKGTLENLLNARELTTASVTAWNTAQARTKALTDDYIKSLTAIDIEFMED